MHPKALLTDKSIDALVRLRELLPGTNDREMIEAALIEMVTIVTQANELRELTAQYEAQRKALFDE